VPVFTEKLRMFLRWWGKSAV